MTARLSFSTIVRTLPVLLISVAGLSGCEGSGNDNHNHSGSYYHGVGFYDPYYYGGYDYDDYDPVILPPSYERPVRPGSGERPDNGLKPSHPIALPPDVSNRPGKPSVNPMPAHRKPSIPSRARPSSMNRSSGMRGGSWRGGGGMRGGGMRGGGRR